MYNGINKKVSRSHWYSSARKMWLQLWKIKLYEFTQYYTFAYILRITIYGTILLKNLQIYSIVSPIIRYQNRSSFYE